MTAEQAAERLGITLPTLYSYVSRGLLRSESPREGSRERRYRTEDVEALRRRRGLRRAPERALEESLHWGLPVLESALTSILHENLYYRGHDVLELAQTASFESVAWLLWTGELREPAAEPAPPLPALPHAPPFARMAAAVALVDDPAAGDLRPAAVARCGLRILDLLTTVLTGPGAQGVAARLAAAWGRPDARASLESALVLCADHELNVSAFAARCAASAGATPWAAVAAGLAAFSGPRHGGQCRRVEALFAEAERVGPRAAVEGRLRRGDEVPGFGQPLYPQGDPRGRALLELARDPLAGELCQVARERLREEPTIDLGLVALARALRLPEDAPMLLFALGRSAGWVAHALEGITDGRLIRPRARYVGKPPQGFSSCRNEP